MNAEGAPPRVTWWASRRKVNTQATVGPRGRGRNRLGRSADRRALLSGLRSGVTVGAMNRPLSPRPLPALAVAAIAAPALAGTDSDDEDGGPVPTQTQVPIVQPPAPAPVGAPAPAAPAPAAPAPAAPAAPAPERREASVRHHVAGHTSRAAHTRPSHRTVRTTRRVRAVTRRTTVPRGGVQAGEGGAAARLAARPVAHAAGGDAPATIPSIVQTRLTRTENALDRLTG